MVFRKESRHDSFQRQISALRQQLSADQDEDIGRDDQPSPPIQFSSPAEPQFRSDLPAPQPSDLRPVSGETGVIAAGSSLSGTLRSDGSVHIFGSVDGEIIAEDDIFVAEGASVDAQVSATNVIVAGRLGGTITCRNRLEVWPTGHISGDVSSPSLVVHEGATVDGKVAMRPTNDTA